MKSALKSSNLRLVASPPPERRESSSELRSLQEAVRNGHPGWQRQLFDRFAPLVHRLLVKTLGPSQDIEDTISEVFLRLFDHVHQVKDAERLSGYVVSVTMNAARREIRRRKRERLFRQLGYGPPEIDSQPALDDPRAKAALLQLGRLLEQLPSNERIAFVLHVLEGMSLWEIAEITRVSHSTAKRRVRRSMGWVIKRASRNVLLSQYIRDQRDDKRKDEGGADD